MRPPANRLTDAADDLSIPLASWRERLLSGLLSILVYLGFQIALLCCAAVLVPSLILAATGIDLFIYALPVLISLVLPLFAWAWLINLEREHVNTRHVKVLLDDGRWPSFTTHLIRTFFWLVGTLALGIGNVSILFHPRRKAIHDMIAGTIVVPGSFRPESMPICPECGYNLFATPDRCPECGREITRSFAANQT